jgi:hypothetical protein
MFHRIAEQVEIVTSLRRGPTGSEVDSIKQLCAKNPSDFWHQEEVDRRCVQASVQGCSVLTLAELTLQAPPCLPLEEDSELQSSPLPWTLGLEEDSECDLGLSRGADFSLAILSCCEVGIGGAVGRS